MNVARSLVCMSWLSFSCLTSTVEAVQPMTSITASFAVMGPYTIKTTIRTNLPDDATIGISLRFLGIEASNPALGLQSHQVKVSGGKATVTVDQSQATTSIPSGDYRIRVSYNPMLPENRTSVLKGMKQYAFFEGTVRIVGDNMKYSDIRRADRGFEEARMLFSSLPYKTARSEMLAQFRKYGSPSALNMNDATGKGTAYYYRAIDATLVAYQDSGYAFRRGRFYR